MIPEHGTSFSFSLLSNLFRHHQSIAFWTDQLPVTLQDCCGIVLVVANVFGSGLGASAMSVESLLWSQLCSRHRLRVVQIRSCTICWRLRSPVSVRRRFWRPFSSNFNSKRWLLFVIAHVFPICKSALTRTLTSKFFFTFFFNNFN